MEVAKGRRIIGSGAVTEGRMLSIVEVVAVQGLKRKWRRVTPRKMHILHGYSAGEAAVEVGFRFGPLLA
jgi:hypothetical protein